jgi:rare lipoprotein A
MAGCGFFSGLSSSGGGDYAPSAKLDPKRIKDAVPRSEPKSRGGNRNPYTVLGKTYAVLPSAAGFKERGVASWYGSKFHGRLTANGEKYDMYAMTAAHKHLPLPSYVQVKNLSNGKTIIVRVNDRGPFHGGRIIDLSYAAATKLGMLGKGTARVEVEAINPAQWAKRQKQQPAGTAVSAKKPSVAAGAAVASSATADSQSELLYLQVGAFSQLNQAQRIQNQLLAAFEGGASDYRIVIHPTDTHTPVYRVRIGPLPDMQVLKQVKSTTALNTFDKMYAVRDPL